MPLRCDQLSDSGQRVGRGKLSPPALALLALAPDAMVCADARAAAVLAPIPLAVMLADARAPAVLADAPLAVMRADAAVCVCLCLSQDWEAATENLDQALLIDPALEC